MPIKGGYYIKARCISESWIAHSAPIDREVWDYLMREANHEDKKYNGFIVKRGQLFRSYRDIREELHWKAGCCKKFYSESAMKRCMKRLREALMIELVSEPRGNLITVCNYDYYQDPKNYARTSAQTDQRTSGEPVANQERPAINKNVKNDKNEKKRKILLADNYNFENISDSEKKQWSEAYPAIDIENQILRAATWLKANPKNKKKDYERFLVNWLSRAQDRAPKIVNGKKPRNPFEGE